MALFDRYVAVDWSAAATPTTGANSIWVADLMPGRAPKLTNHATRALAAGWLGQVVGDAVEQRVLVGIDASFGYPQGSSMLFGLGGVPWRAMWHAVAGALSDDDRNLNNRFDVAAALNRSAGGNGGPFWGCPHDRFEPALHRTKPPMFEVPEFRLVEQRLRHMGRYPKSGWQLLGAGSVGSQTLTLLPYLHRLLDRIEVWPFTTGLQTPSGAPGVVIAEVWPSWFVDRIPPGAVADAVQVEATTAALRDADANGVLESWFCPSVDETATITEEEGWILGVA